MDGFSVPRRFLDYSGVVDVFFWFQEKPEGERELEADPDLIETAGVFAEDSLVNVRKEVDGVMIR